MGSLDAVFPVNISEGAAGGPGYNTNMIRLPSGAVEAVGLIGGAGLREWDVSHARKTPEQAADLLNFYIVSNGGLHDFKFKDPFDNTTAEDHVGAPDASDVRIGVGNGSDTEFQLFKEYTVPGASSFDVQRTISLVDESSLSINVAGSPESGWTLDEETGIVTFTSAPTGAITAGFRFWVPAKFAQPVDVRLLMRMDQRDFTTTSRILIGEIPSSSPFSSNYIHGGATYWGDQAVDRKLDIRNGVTQIFDQTTALVDIDLPAKSGLEYGKWFTVMNVGNTAMNVVDTDLTSTIVTLDGNGTYGKTEIFLAPDSAGNPKWYAMSVAP